MRTDYSAGRRQSLAREDGGPKTRVESHVESGVMFALPKLAARLCAVLPALHVDAFGWVGTCTASRTNRRAGNAGEPAAEDTHPYLRDLDIRRYRRNWKPRMRAADSSLWSANGAPTPQALELVRTLRAAENFGLRSADYDANQLAYLLVDLLTTPSTGDEAWSTFDVGLTSAALAYVNDLHFGRIDPREAGLALSVEHARLDLQPRGCRLEPAATMSPVSLHALEPPFLHYDLLKRALQRYRDLALEPGLGKLPPFDARSIKPGDPYAGAAQLRSLLVALGDLPAAAATPSAGADGILDPQLRGRPAQAFRSGTVWMRTARSAREHYRALTVPLSIRARQIELTLERWRWLPPKLDTPPIVVNIPQFRLFAFRTVEDREADMLPMDVIVGKAFRAHQTPVFVSDMKYVVLRPYWDVPYSITDAGAPAIDSCESGVPGRAAPRDGERFRRRGVSIAGDAGEPRAAGNRRAASASAAGTAQFAGTRKVHDAERL